MSYGVLGFWGFGVLGFWGQTGLAVGLVAIWFITRGPTDAAADSASTKSSTTALIMGALAGTGFGAQLILFKIATVTGGILWAMTAARGAGVTAMLLVLLVMPPSRPWRGFWGFGILAGILDTAGNLLYIQAASFGRLDVAALVCSLYPGGTILLAGLVLKERPTRRQLAGIALALVSVALLSI